MAQESGSPDDDNNAYNASVFDLAKGGLFGGFFSPAGLDPNVAAVIMDYRWTTAYLGSTPATSITYFFPTSPSDYNIYPAPNPANPFGTTPAGGFALSDVQQRAVLAGMGMVESYTNLTFAEAASGSAADATLRFINWVDPDTSSPGSAARFPTNASDPQAGYDADARDAGDNFLYTNARPPTDQFFGTDHFNTIIHEMGHALGLKHGHDPSLNGALAPDVNDNEFSVMTYASWLGANLSGGATEARVGSSPQSYMMYDIAALQTLYGVNMSKVGTTAVYRWDADGQQTINGENAPDTGTSVTRKIFSTVWTAGAFATYDLSNFHENQVDDLRPGRWLTFSHAQLADLNSNAPEGTEQYLAQGNIYNALLFDGDTRSAVSGLITGSGNDTITGNDYGNTLDTGSGYDNIHAGAGNDTIRGGADPDTIDPGGGLDILRDSLANMNGDTIFNFGFGVTIDASGALIGRANLVVTLDPGGDTTLGLGGSQVLIEGTPGGGDFMTVARGIGPDAHTLVTFEPYLPNLQEGVRVEADAINGVSNLPFLTGDGSVRFTMDFQQAVSGFDNALGVYKIAADGTIFDVHMVLASTLGASAGATFDLGTPGAGVTIGFFLVQNGFTQFGTLPDNLSFVAAGGGPGDADAGQPVVLYSATMGMLAGATVFHSTQSLNPDDAIQVLSGVAPGGRVLQIGFEDLPNATGDNDFQDVVIAVHSNHDTIYVL